MISTTTTKLTATRKSSRSKTRRRSDAARRKVPTTHLSKRSARHTTVAAPQAPRRESKQQICLVLLSRPEGASIEELQKRTGWQAHSVRGFLAGAVKRKLGMALVSEKAQGQPRRYRIPQATA